MLWLRNGARLTALLTVTLLTGCVGGTVTGAGCVSYAEARLALPGDDALLATPREVLDWINETDARMTGACT